MPGIGRFKKQMFWTVRQVVLRFVEPSLWVCLLEPWCREMGFVVCYGSIILKLYR